MARPSTFNDPFDCAMPIDSASVTQENMKNLISHLSAKFIPEATFPKEEIERQARQEMSDFENGMMFKRVVKSVDETFRILSLASGEKVPFNLLMWSHYADSHKGICLEFDGTTEAFTVGRKKVDYDSPNPLIDIWSGDLDKRAAEFLKALTVKASEWRYEEEYRVIEGLDAPSDKPVVLTFPSEALVAVRFGLSISDDDRTELLKVILKREAKPKIFEMRRSQDSIGLIEVEIHP